MKELTCIICPRGCRLKVDDQLNVTGNFCTRGKQYAINELTHPMRTITSTVRVCNRLDCVVAVKTVPEIPKDKIFAVMNEINKVKINAPCHIGQIVIKNVLNLNSDIVVCQNIE